MIERGSHADLLEQHGKYYRLYTNLKKVSGTTLSPSSASGAGVAGVQPGQTIEHERFGLGEVIRVEGTGDNAKATIHFRNAGDKQLLLRFARFKLIE